MNATFEASAAARQKTLEAAEQELQRWRDQLAVKRRQVEQQSEQERHRLREEVNSSRWARAEREGTPFDEVQLIPPTPELNSPASGRFDFSTVMASPTPAEPPKRANEQRSSEGVYSFDKLRANVPGSAAGRGGQSLASFMGGTAKGPVLNKPRPLNDHGLEVDTAPVPSFMTKNPALLQRDRIPLPGMVLSKPKALSPEPAWRKAATAPTHSSAAPLAKQPTGSKAPWPPEPRVRAQSMHEREIANLARTSPVSARRAFGAASDDEPGRPRPTGPTRSLSRPEISTATASAPLADRPSTSRQPSAEAKSPAYASLRSTSPAAVDALSVRQPSPTPSSAPATTKTFSSIPRTSPIPASSAPSTTFARPAQPPKPIPGPKPLAIPTRSATVPQPSWSQADKAPTNSLTRLQASSIVKQRLEAVGQQPAAAAATSTRSRSAEVAPPQQVQTPTPSKRASVLDRWNYGDIIAAAPTPTSQAAKRASVLSRWTAEPAAETGETPPQPVALPGMTRPGSRPPPVSRPSAEEVVQATPKPLVHLTKERAQGPKRNKPRTSLTTTPLASTSGFSTPVDSKPPALTSPIKAAIGTLDDLPPTTPLSPLFDDAQRPSFSRTISVRPDRSSRPSSPVKRDLPSPPVASPTLSSKATAFAVDGPHPSSRVALPGMTRSAPSIYPSRSAPVNPGPSTSVKPSRVALPGMTPSKANEPTVSKLMDTAEDTLHSSIKPSSRAEPVHPRPTAMTLARQFQAEALPKPSRAAPVQSSTPRHRLTSSDFDTLLRPLPRPTPPDRGELLALESLALSADGAKTLTGSDAHTFYHHELVVLVGRFRASSAGDRTVTTHLWVWRGTGSTATKGEAKLAELEARYKMPAEVVEAGREPTELVELLGGVLVVRQGQRHRFDPVNTALYRVMEREGVVFVDEVDLHAESICSAYCYVLSMGVLDAIVIWQGRGSTPLERKQAEQYGRPLQRNGRVTIEREQDMKPSSLFAQTLALGDDALYASANYWRSRSAAWPAPLVYAGDITSKPAIAAIDRLPVEVISLIDAHVDLFVLVPSDSANKRADVIVALDAAEHLARRPGRPQRPAVHVLSFPSLVPLDLACLFRARDLDALNGSTVPRTLRLFDIDEARAALM